MVRDARFTDLEISYFRWGGGSLGSMSDWLVRASSGSDEVRLVRVVAGA